MIAADHPDRGGGKALARLRRRRYSPPSPRDDLAALFEPGDLVVANDAATLPASLSGTHAPDRRADRSPPRRLDQTRRPDALHRGRLRRRRPPHAHRGSSASACPLTGDRLALGPLDRDRRALLGHPAPRRASLPGTADAIWAGLAHHGRPIQYAHVPEPLALWDVWTTIAAPPGRLRGALGRLRARLANARRMALARRRLRHPHPRRRNFLHRRRGARRRAALRRALPHPAGDRRPRSLARGRAAEKSSRSARPSSARSKPRRSGRKGRTPATASRTGRIGPDTEIAIVDAILSGVHQAGESHFELLRAFADDATLDAMRRSSKHTAIARTSSAIPS